MDGKNFLAQYAGSGVAVPIGTPIPMPGYCFVTSGLTYYDSDGVSHTGGTVDVTSSFLGAHMLGKDTAVIIAGKTYLNMKAANDNTDLVLDDITWVYQNDGHSGTTAYCYTCTPIVCSFTVT